MRFSLRGATNADAARCSEMVVLATPWDVTALVARGLASELDGKTVVSMANPLVRSNSEQHALLLPRGSVAAHVQAAVPTARVVAALHHVPTRQLASVDQRIAADVLVCGDDEGAVELVCAMLAGIPGCRALNAGQLSNACAIEAFTGVLRQLDERYKTEVAPWFCGIDR